MKIEEFFTPEEWSKILGLTAKITGLACTTFDLEANPVNKPEFSNEVCPLLKSRPETAIECKNSQIRLAKEAMETGKPVFGRCNAGFVKVVVPVKYKGEIIGMTGGCGVCYVDDDEEECLKKMCEVGAKAGLENQIKEKFSTVRKISKELLQQAIASLEKKLELREKQI